eukprot:TRINITY_DN2411_c0_g1_i17.p1 TRINITY_DN2411_c0_g1~~TRINITY_DN2411_c0_g1_i17.p1  ORF type:complete len:575 (+),score=54.98 TRINITY_DN2411_c0_g1_i17:81-1805(+)
MGRFSSIPCFKRLLSSTQLQRCRSRSSFSSPTAGRACHCSHATTVSSFPTMTYNDASVPSLLPSGTHGCGIPDQHRHRAVTNWNHRKREQRTRHRRRNYSTAPQTNHTGISDGTTTVGFRDVLSVAPMMEVTSPHYRYLIRLLTEHTVLYTEMVTAAAVLRKAPLSSVLPSSRERASFSNPTQIQPLRKLRAHPMEDPVVVQLGGANADDLYAATRLVASTGQFSAVNLNCGCPSPRVAGAGGFGASLMLEPKLLLSLVQSMRRAVRDSTREGARGIEVTVKCRIGVDDSDSYEALSDLISLLSAGGGGVQHFVVHARKAFLQGLDPAQNRSIPPLDYGVVKRLRSDFPHLFFTLNGGVMDLPSAASLIKDGYAHGVMIGRAAMNNPWMFVGADRLISGVLSGVPTLESRSSFPSSSPSSSASSTLPTQSTPPTSLPRSSPHAWGESSRTADQSRCQAFPSSERALLRPLSSLASSSSSGHSHCVSSPKSHRSVLQMYAQYCDRMYTDHGDKLPSLLKPIMGLFPGENGTRLYRRHLSDWNISGKQRSTTPMPSNIIRMATHHIDDEVLDRAHG